MVPGSQPMMMTFTKTLMIIIKTLMMIIKTLMIIIDIIILRDGNDDEVVPRSQLRVTMGST